MPFDGAGFRPEPEQPRRRPASSTAATFIIVALAFCLLAVPISLSAFVDITRYLGGR